MNILIVDDSKVFRTVVERAVASLGHETFATPNAEEALDILRERNIDLICSALTLPAMNGIDAPFLYCCTLSVSVACS